MFINRKDAALQLAMALQKYKGKAVIVLGIPRGGAETAFYVARELEAEFSLLFSKKLSHPDNPEFAVGAIAEDGSVYLADYARDMLSDDMIDRAVEQQQKEIDRRIHVLRKGSPLPDLRNRTVILVDDGIATGATLFAAISMCKKQGSDRIVVGAPVSGKEMKRKLLESVDEVVILETPDFYQSVSQVYESFYNMTDEEVLAFMQRDQAA